MHSTSGRALKNEPVCGMGIPENGGQRPAGGPAAARGGRPTILLHVSQFMAGRPLAEYAFHSGFLPSLLGTLPLGGLFGATPKIPPGIETGQHSVRLGSIRGTGRSRGRLAVPPVPSNGSGPGCQSRAPKRPMGRAGSAGPIHNHNIVLTRTEAEARCRNFMP